jgi:hypothetical protein
VKRPTLFLIPFLAVLGCSREPQPGDRQRPSAGAPPGEAGHEPHGERVDLGKAKIGDVEIHVFQIVKPAPGKEADFDLEFAAGTVLPVIRGWIGVESGVGSRKTRFAKESDTLMHGHPETPDPLAPEARFWIEVESKGALAKGSFALVR